MDITFFAKRLLRPCIITTLALSICMIKSAGATPITPTTVGSFTNLEGCSNTFQIPPDNHEFSSRTIDVTTSTKMEFLRPTLFTVAQIPQHLESSPDTGSFQGFSAGLPSEIRSISTNITSITDVDSFNFFRSDDITGSFAGDAESFPILTYDDASFSFAQHHLVPHIPIPEPSTLVLFTTVLSSIYYAYGLWRHRKQEAAQPSIETMAVEVMQDIKDALTAIQTCVEVLGYNNLDPHDRQAFTRKMIGEVEQCVAMVQAFLGSRPDRFSKTCQVSELHLQTVEDPPMTQTMNILLLDMEKTWVEDIQEAFQNLPITIYAADSQQEARRILARQPITIAIFALRTLTDLEFLHELNTTYRQIEVILTVENAVKEIVTILQKGAYRVMLTPVTPSALRAYIETIKKKG